MTLTAAIDTFTFFLQIVSSLIPLSCGHWFRIVLYLNGIDSYVTAASICLRWIWRSQTAPFRERFSRNYFRFASARTRECSIPKRFEIICRVCARHRNYPSIAASSARSLSRCRVDFDPARQPGVNENSYQQVVTSPGHSGTCSSGRAKNRSKSCYADTRVALFINSWISS